LFIFLMGVDVCVAAVTTVTICYCLAPQVRKQKRYGLGPKLAFLVVVVIEMKETIRYPFPGRRVWSLHATCWAVMRSVSIVNMPHVVAS
jgi:hypothetical protein